MRPPTSALGGSLFGAGIKPPGRRLGLGEIDRRRDAAHAALVGGAGRPTESRRARARDRLARGELRA